MKVDVAVLGSPSPINRPSGLCGRQATLNQNLRGFERVGPATTEMKGL